MARADLPYRKVSKSNYRPDIDGLRAIAILLVVSFHGFPTIVAGGYIGVSIFFVISGYLISSIIYKSLDKGRFDYVDFYIRRIRRIFPALIFILMSAFAIGWFVMLADEYKQLGKYIAGGAGFIDNFIAWQEAGYFDNQAEFKPLLHLWSLGIEEWFYIVWPLLLWLACKCRFNLLTVTILVAAISFALNVYGIKHDAVATFYAPWSRFWELLSGGVLAYLHLYKPNGPLFLRTKIDSILGKVIYAIHTNADGSTFRNIYSLTGFGLILYGVLTLNKQTLFPGWHALLPVLGALSLIAGGEQSYINRKVLANRIMVWFGLISYPLYLWHWMLLSFLRVGKGEEIEIRLRLATIAIAIAMSWLTYKLIENPIRFGSFRKTKSVILVLLMLSIGYVGYYIYERDGLKFREDQYPIILNEGDTGHDQYMQYQHKYFYPCMPEKLRNDAERLNGYVQCFQSKNGDKIDLAIIGDSHASHLFIGLAEQLDSLNIVYYSKSYLPVVSSKDFKEIFEYVLANKDIKVVILSSAWYRRFIDEVPSGSTFRKELTDTILKLTHMGKHVYVADDNPNFTINPENCKFKRFFYKNLCNQDSNLFNATYDKYFPDLQSAILGNSNAKILKIKDLFCFSRTCTMAIDGKILFRDGHHLNINGSKYVAKKILENNPELKGN